jgi:hypothetical protein
MRRTRPATRISDPGGALRSAGEGTPAPGETFAALVRISATANPAATATAL